MNNAHHPLNALANTLSRTRQAQHLPRPLCPGCAYGLSGLPPRRRRPSRWREPVGGVAPGIVLSESKIRTRKTPICLRPEPLAKGEFGGALALRCQPGFRAAAGRLFFGFFLLATQKKEPRCRSTAACKQHRAAVHQTYHQRLAASLAPRMRLRLIRATSHRHTRRPLISTCPTTPSPTAASAAPPSGGWPVRCPSLPPARWPPSPTTGCRIVPA